MQFCIDMHHSIILSFIEYRPLNIRAHPYKTAAYASFLQKKRCECHTSMLGIYFVSARKKISHVLDRRKMFINIHTIICGKKRIFRNSVFYLHLITGS